jgi:hypothetical protein
MRLLAVTAVTATVLVFALPQTSPVLAQAPDVGAASRPYPLDGGPSSGSDNRGQSSGEQSERTERSGDVSSEKSRTSSGKAGESQHHGGRNAIHRHSHHASAFSHSRHHLLIHRRGHRVAALDEPGSM